MKHCEYCNVAVDGASGKCPLCGKPLSGESQKEALYPAYETREAPAVKSNVRYKMAAITLAIVGACGAVNLATRGQTGGYWFLDVAVILAYLWVLVLHTVRSKVRGCFKFFVQVSMISLMLVVFDLNAGGGLWSVMFAIPIEAVAMISLATYIVFTRKMRWSEYLGYGFIVLFIGFAPMLSVELGIVRMAWPFLVCAGYAIVTFIFMIMFAEKKYKESSMRRFRF